MVEHRLAPGIGSHHPEDCLAVIAAADHLNAKDGYEITKDDARMLAEGNGQLFGQFLLDREGIVRWANVECEADGFAGIGKFPSDDEILAAVRVVA